MKPGTPQFVGERLREVREARSLAAAALSELIGVTRQAVSQYENGPQTPSPAVLRRIAEVLRVQTHFFLRPVHQTADGTIFYRSMAAATKAARLRAQSRFKWTQEIVRYVRTFVNFPAVNYPLPFVSGDPLKISKLEVEEAAAITRRHWGLGDGPISNVVLLLENNGTIIVRHDIAAKTIDAFSMWSSEDRTPYVVLNSEKGVAVRSRFDVAHELGHLILHRSLPSGLLKRQEMFDVIEEQAFAFARAFLLPEKTFAADVFSPTLDTFRALKAKWKVSIQAMIVRAADLGLLTADQERRIWPNLSRRRWRTFEPMDDTLEPESPKLLRRSVELMFMSGTTTPQDMIAQTGLSQADIEELIGLSTGYLTGHDWNPETDPSVIKFPSSRRPAELG